MGTQNNQPARAIVTDVRPRRQNELAQVPTIGSENTSLGGMIFDQKALEEGAKKAELWGSLKIGLKSQSELARPVLRWPSFISRTLAESTLVFHCCKVLPAESTQEITASLRLTTRRVGFRR